MAKKKHHGSHEEHMDESWLIPYADLLTLLLALFIVLFASSNVDKDKYASMAEVFSKEIGLDPPTSNTIGIDPLNSAPKTQPNEFDQNASKGQTAAEQKKEMVDKLQDTFKTYVEENDLTSQLQVAEKGDGLLITLTSDVWFPSGSATINQGHIAVAKEVATMIADADKKNNNQHFKLTISGYTDNRPISTSTFPSNWALSVMRAVNFLQAMLDNSDIDPGVCMARGLGENEPVDTNATAEGRQHNRRVEVFISFLE